MLKDSVSNIYKIFYPEGTRLLPLVFDSPHSGRNYPENFDFSCPFRLLQKAEDNYVDDLFSDAPKYGATLLCAEFPRTYIDVNRSEGDIDTSMIRDEWPFPYKTSRRSHAGIGLIRRLLQPGLPVYNRKLYAKEVIGRIENYYRPYHAALRTTMDEAHYNFGQVWHINCHSMPASSATSFFPYEKTTGQNHIPDFVLGNRDGTSCSADFTEFVESCLKDMGYSVAINKPYKGVELVRRYSRPSAGRHSLQIEINKALYWDEASGIKTINYNKLKNDMGSFIKQCADFTESRLVNLAAD